MLCPKCILGITFIIKWSKSGSCWNSINILLVSGYLTLGKQVKSLQNLVSNSQAKIQSLAIQDMAKIEKIYKK